MTGDTVQYQGEGTYTYNCEYPDCWYCGLMKIKHGGHGKRNYGLGVNRQRRKVHYWPPKDVKKLYQMRYSTVNDLVELFKGRSRNAIINKRYTMNKKIKETKIPELITD